MVSIYWHYDEGGSLESILGNAKDPLEPLIELYQNEFDSVIPPLSYIESNNLTRDQIYGRKFMIRTKIPGKKDPILIKISNIGSEGITRDYNFDLNNFLHSLKADSTKMNHPFTIGHKGQGMGLFYRDSDLIKITSMTPESKYLIQQFYMATELDEKGRRKAKYDNPLTTGATNENRDKYGIHKQGTITEFYRPTRPVRLVFSHVMLSRYIKNDELIKRLKDVFGLRISWCNNLRWEFSDGGHYEYVDMVPDWIKDNPEEVIGNFELDGIKFTVTGNMWSDQNGNSCGKLIGQGGQTIEREHPLWEGDEANKTRRCSYYVFVRPVRIGEGKYHMGLEELTDRKGIVRDEIYTKTIELLRNLAVARDYPLVKSTKHDEMKGKEDKIEAMNKAFSKLMKDTDVANMIGSKLGPISAEIKDSGGPNFIKKTDQVIISNIGGEIPVIPICNDPGPPGPPGPGGPPKTTWPIIEDGGDKTVLVSSGGKKTSSGKTHPELQWTDMYVGPPFTFLGDMRVGINKVSNTYKTIISLGKGSAAVIPLFIHALCRWIYRDMGLTEDEWNRKYYEILEKVT